jgi:acyl-CoA reductase-like NAD-dependent aldehyde dehydrogenase
MSRLPVTKALKLFVGGQFPRSESGRTLSTPGFRGGVVHVARASRKDVRDAEGVARAAQPKWAAKTAYNRGQILYRLAEMLEDRLTTLPTTAADAAAAADRAVYHAGWCDKATALLSSLNPVAATYVNYSMVRPIGVVVAVPDPADGLLGLVEATCAPLVMGNAVICVVAPERAELAIALGEAWAVSDLPGGVVNLLTGLPKEILEAASRHDDIDAIWLSAAHGADLRKDADLEGARVIRRIVEMPPAARPAGPIELSKLAEVKTVWMSAYEPVGGGAAY